MLILINKPSFFRFVITKSPVFSIRVVITTTNVDYLAIDFLETIFE